MEADARPIGQHSEDQLHARAVKTDAGPFQIDPLILHPRIAQPDADLVAHFQEHLREQAD
jgi:hypothetical protein